MNDHALMCLNTVNSEHYDDKYLLNTEDTDRLEGININHKGLMLDDSRSGLRV